MKLFFHYFRSVCLILCAVMVSGIVVVIVSGCEGTFGTSNPDTPTTLSTISTRFTESSANDGSIGSSFSINSLVGSGFISSPATLVLGTHYTIKPDLPAGLTPEVTVSGGDATFSLKGNALAHTSNESVSNLTITFLKAAFVGNQDATNGTVTFSISFSDVDPEPTLSYPSDTFAESADNDGSVDTEIFATLSNDQFSLQSQTLTLNTHYELSGTALPAGLTFVLETTNDDRVKFSLAGSASSHANAQSVSGVIVTLLPAAFESGEAPSDGSASKSFSITFSDPARPTLSYAATSFTESGTNGGAISATIDITASSDVWSISSGTFTANTHYTLTGTSLPAGLSAVLTYINSTTARLSLTGTAASHAAASSVSGITLTFLGAAFSNAQPPNNGTQAQNLSIVFKDPYNLTYSATSFLENTSNAGGISDTVDVTLANDTWAIGSGTFTLNTHYTLTGTAVPAGLTAVLTRISSTVARLSFTGAATSHASANDVSGITLTFLGAALTGGTAPSNGSQAQNFSIDFSDSNILLYSAGTYNGNLGGRSGADAKCAAERPTGYRNQSSAFISVSATDELQDMTTLYSIPSSQEIVSSSGTPIANDWADLIDGSINANLLAAGILLMPDNWWSGSTNSGAISINHCLNWTSDTAMTDTGATGISYSTSNWMDILDDDCSNEHVLLCVAFQ